MTPHIAISAAHLLYLAGVLAIIVTMMLRTNVVVPSIVATFLVSLAWTGSPIDGIASIFNASFKAATELFNIFLVIALITALLNALKALGSDVLMVKPFRKVMTNGHVAFFVLTAITYVISLFFWPTPAVPLVSAVLLPAAIVAGLPPLAGALAIAIAGQGMALSSDYVIGVAPGISAKAAGAAANVTMVADRALALSLITGGVALLLAYLSIRKSIVPGNEGLLVSWQKQTGDGDSARLEAEGTFDKAEIARGSGYAFDQTAVVDENTTSPADATRAETWSKLFAILAPLGFLLVVAIMVVPKFDTALPDLKGGDAAALIGGMGTILMILATFAADGFAKSFEACADHITDGFVFAFKAMGSVLPIAGFFFMGAGGATAAAILNVPAAHAPSFLFDLVQAAQAWIPHSHYLVGFGVLIVGMITGIDGSGFSGLPLTGSLSGALAPTVGLNVNTLAAIGQMGSIWTGGGTLIAWSSLIAVAGFARVSVLDTVRALAIPVLAGLAVSTVCGIMFWN